MANYFCFDKSCLSGFSLKANSYDDYRTGVAISFQLFKLYYPVYAMKYFSPVCSSAFSVNPM